jgi:hypothetical protein
MSNGASQGFVAVAKILINEGTTKEDSIKDILKADVVDIVELR